MRTPPDRFAALKDDYEKEGPTASNMRYGYVAGPIDHALFADPKPEPLAAAGDPGGCRRFLQDSAAPGALIT